MEAGEGLSLEQMRSFLEGSAGIDFAVPNRKDLYAWTGRVLVGQGYQGSRRADKGWVRLFIGKVTGRSRAQVARMIGQYLASGEVKSRRGQGRRFEGRYTREDIALLAEVDEAHGGLSGPATQKILYRGYFEFAEARFERLAGISASHIYNLRRRKGYRERRLDWEKTRPTPVAIGERRKPDARGLPGSLRIDTVHQGDEDGVKGVYHINAVDEVTQWQIVTAVAQISEAWLIPALESMLRQFPFEIRGFHSDNGSEFINRKVEKLLKKLLIEQTKSRAGHSNDNALVEAKNGAVVRKHMGHEHIAAAEAEGINAFYEEHLNGYLNYHRPCGVPEVKTDAKGKRRRFYRWYATPWEILRQLPERCLREGVMVEELEWRAGRQSDTQAAARMQEAKRQLFAGIREREIA